MEINPIVTQIGVGILTFLASVNIYFIKSLVSKIDRADLSLTKYEEQIRQLKEQIGQFSVFIKDVTDLKSEVAVLKYALGKEQRGD